jgi:hypothetical protein
MIAPLKDENSLLRVDEDGAIRIGDTRVLLELVVRKYDGGATPEEIVQSYES